MNGINSIRRHYLIKDHLNSEYMESDDISPLEGVTNFKAETIQYELDVTLKSKNEVEALSAILERIHGQLDD